ncbi:MAG: bifunctional ornithine acetyltransferase/N-acetylglutamate synthase [Acidiferrobacteraceae bacterium]|nr:bifunctional ornithine acetyltransferase/N-acetylglutamate synthase [Acidiferrobacteraceae bacterium]
MLDMKSSSLAPQSFPELPMVQGVRIATDSANIAYRDRDDLLLVEFAPGTSVAGVFTTSSTAAASVSWSRGVVTQGYARALLANSGNANAFTGKQGMFDVERSAKIVSAMMHCEPQEVLIASTGVIGEPLPMDRIGSVLPLMKTKLGLATWESAARSILTTDTFPKGASRTLYLGDQRIKIVGIAKGSGMIAPNMATMLAFVFTDANIAPNLLSRLISKGADSSFNSITVDGDTSTNDTLLIAATGLAGNACLDSIKDHSLTQFRRALNGLLQELAIQIIRDGEGASKLITIEVRGASSTTAARKAGLAIANSPLVKTAIAGEDANWGRIVMAIGKSGVRIDPSKISVEIGDVIVAREGQREPTYDESVLTGYLSGDNIVLGIDLGAGQSRATVWTCDLTHDYIRINADYRS